MATVSAEPLICTVCGYEAANRTGLSAHTRLKHTLGDGKTSETASAQELSRDSLSAPHEIGIEEVFGLPRNALYTVAVVGLVVMGGVLGLLGLSSAVLVGMMFSLAAMVVAAMRISVRVHKVLVWRLVDDVPVASWEWWRIEDVRALPEHVEWENSKGKRVPVIDAIDSESPRQFAPDPPEHPFVSSEIVAYKIDASDYQQADQHMSRRTLTLQALQVGALVAAVGILGLLNFVVFTEVMDRI